ncbi:MAG: M20 family metallopeptidase [Candidatus Latescibacterota bacterium]|nr:M20 family metallopeptidase [Candidatus Latescibacterota bacterium]
MNAFEAIEKSQRRLSRDLAAMVRIPTVNPPGENYRSMVEYLRRRCRELGLKTSLNRVPDADLEAAGIDPAYPRYNLIARWDMSAPLTVHFNAHYDVVPVSAGDWRASRPFDGTVSGDWLHGRGSGDMKGSVAALFGAIEGLRRSGTKPAVNVECSFTADEETGGALGAGWVVRQGLVSADYAIVCEGSSGSRVGLGHNGVLWLEVTVEGKSAHGSSPDRGTNAFEKMVRLVQQLDPLKRQLASRQRGWRASDGSRRNPTVNVGGVISGGEGQKINTVPGQATFTIDRRLVPSETIAQAESELIAGLEQAAQRVDARHHARALLRIEPCVVDSGSELPQAFARSVRSARRHAADFRVTTGFTDLHYFVVDGGLPGIGYGVGGERAHGSDERVTLRELVQTAKTYSEFLRRGLD